MILCHHILLIKYLCEFFLNKRMGSYQKEKIPYMIIIGDNEIDNDELSIRSRAGENQNNIKLEQFIERLSNE